MKWFLASLVLFTHITAHGEITTTSMPAPANTSPKKVSPVSVKGSALLSVGSTSNAPLLNQSLPGNYLKAAPSISADYLVNDALTISAGLDGSLKYFNDPLVRSLSNEQSYDFKIDVTSFLNDSWEWGTNLSYLNMENHIPVVGTSSVESLPQKYSQPNARIYGAYETGQWLFEIGGTLAPRRYETTTIDILGNIYKNSYDEYKIDEKTSFKISKNSKLVLKLTAEQRNYLERMAEFSEGIPAANGNTNPLLTTFAEDNDLQLKTKIRGNSLATSFNLRFEKDQIYGARDFTRLRLKEKAVFPLFKKTTFEPEISLSKQTYSQFRSDLNDVNSDLRLDWEGHLAATLKFEFTKNAALQIQYALNRKTSNYIPENYLENAIETGLNMQL